VKQKIVGIALILAFVLPVCAAFLYLHLQKRQIRREVKAMLVSGLEEDDFVHITVAIGDTLSPLKWEHSHEFEYQGEMYDVVKRYAEGDSVRYVCWWDNEETECNQQLRRLAADYFGKRQDSQQSKARVKLFMKNLFFDCFSPDRKLDFFTRGQVPYFSLSLYSNPWQKLLSEPPDELEFL
jgi:hypothetical protein